MADNQSRSRLWIIALLLLGSIALVVLLFYFFGKVKVEEEPITIEPTIVSPKITSLAEVTEYVDVNIFPKVSEEKSAGNILSGEHIHGDVLAGISIVEYSNFTNEYSSIIQKPIRDFVDKNESINLIFRHFPSPDDENDYEAAYISECVFQQLDNEGFWSYADLVFERGVGTVDELVAYGEEVGADADQLRLCMSDEQIVKRVKDDKITGYSKGKVRVAPTFFFVDNRSGETRVVEGIMTIEYFQRIVDFITRLQQQA